MDFAIAANVTSRPDAGLLVIPFWKHKKGAECAADDVEFLKDCISAPIGAGDFEGSEGEILVLYSTGACCEPRIALLGLGDSREITVEKLRRSFAGIAKVCKKKKIKEINLVVPRIPRWKEEAIVGGIAEGLLLSNYSFCKLKGIEFQKNVPVAIVKTVFIGVGTHALAAAKKCNNIIKAVNFVRDLVNDNADTVNPQYLAGVAKDLAEKLPHTKATVYDKEWLKKKGMGLVYAVGRASSHPPALIILEYKGAPKSKELTVLVGKGVTYDTGGLDLKNVAGFGSMESMKADMGGAGTVLGTLYAAAALGLKVNLTIVIPAVENAICATSFKPGDVYTSYAGKTIEITSTDAEGRLILADALAYAVKQFKPTRIIDFATLTGGIDIALGAEYSGLMSNDDQLAKDLEGAGLRTGERAWRLPLVEEYREMLKSDVADMKNTAGRAASSIKAALFLQEFVGNVPWAHFDIASTAFLAESLRYHPKHATGIGVRLMIDYLENK